MRFVAHASSSGGNLYTLESGGSILALECGVSPADLRAHLRHEIHKLDACLLSHHHGDHSRSALEVLKAGVPLYAARECLQACGINHPGARAVEERREFSIPAQTGGEWYVLPFALKHDAVATMGFLIEHRGEGSRALFACDTAWVPALFRDVEIIAIEVNHSEELLRASRVPLEQRRRSLRSHHSLERALDWLGRMDLRCCREIHLLHLSDNHSDEAGFVAAVRAATGVPTFAAPRRRPTV